MAARKERAAAPKKARRSAKTPSSSAEVRVTPDELRKLISEAAYYRAKQRGFAPGHETEDWIEAEAEVRKRIGA